VGVFFNLKDLSEYKAQRQVQYSFYRVIWLLLEVYGELVRYTVPVLGDGVHSFKPSKIWQSSAHDYSLRSLAAM